jgi:hypothetical protein
MESQVNYVDTSKLTEQQKDVLVSLAITNIDNTNEM